MISLDYNLDPGYRKQLEGVDLSAAADGDMHYNLFLGNIFFIAEGVDFSAPWAWVPVLDFVICMSAVLRDLPQEGSLDFTFTESDDHIGFIMHGDNVQISSNYIEGVATVRYRDLVTAVTKFAGRVVRELGEQYPALKSNPTFSEFARELEASDEDSQE